MRRFICLVGLDSGAEFDGGTGVGWAGVVLDHFCGVEEVRPKPETAFSGALADETMTAC